MATYYQAGGRDVSNSAGTIPYQERRTYDKSDMMIWKELYNAQLLTILSRRMQRQAVKSTSFKTFEVGYGVHKVNILGVSSAAIAVTTTSFTITDEGGTVNANLFLKPGDTINVPYQDNINNSTAMSLAGEEWLVISVSGSTVVVERGGDTDSTATRAAADAAVTLTGYLGPTVKADGSAVGEATTYSADGELNYTENVEEVWEVTGDEQEEEQYGTSDPMGEEARKARMNFFRKVERHLITGMRRKKYVSSKEMRFMGGLKWFIGGYVHYDNANPQTYTSWSSTADMVKGTDATLSQVWKVGDVSSTDNWSERLWWKYCMKAFEFGSTGIKYLICGGGFMLAFQTLFWKYLRMDQLEDVFKMKVMSMETPYGVIKLVRSTEMDRSGMGNEGFLLDLAYIKYVYLRNRNFRVVKNVQNPGDDTRKDCLRGSISLKMNHWRAHSWITGLTNV